MVVFLSNRGTYLTHRKKVILETKEILCVQSSQDLKELLGDHCIFLRWAEATMKHLIPFVALLR